MSTYHAKEDDNNVVITVILYDSLGPADLTGCTVSWIMVNAAGAATTIAATPDPDQVGNTGRVSVTLTSAHLASAASYSVEWQVTCGASIITYPNDGYDRLIVTADLT